MCDEKEVNTAKAGDRDNPKTRNEEVSKLNQKRVSRSKK